MKAETTERTVGDPAASGWATIHRRAAVITLIERSWSKSEVHFARDALRSAARAR